MANPNKNAAPIHRTESGANEYNDYSNYSAAQAGRQSKPAACAWL